MSPLEKLLEHLGNNKDGMVFYCGTKVHIVNYPLAIDRRDERFEDYYNRITRIFSMYGSLIRR